MSDSTALPTDSTPAPPGGKPGSTLVYCELPHNGGTIITTYDDCVILIGGKDVGKVPPPSTDLIACQFGPHTIRTQASDCTRIGGTTVIVDS